MYFNGTVGNICLMAEDKSVNITSAFELKFPASPIVVKEYVPGNKFSQKTSFSELQFRSVQFKIVLLTLITIELFNLNLNSMN